MPSNIFLYMLLAAIIALALAVFQYYYKSGRAYKYPALFTFLRFVTFFSLLVLLINPRLESNEYFIDKADLILAVDNSESIENLGAGAEVQLFVKHITENPEIQDRFDVQVFGFGGDLEPNDDLNFSERQTNIQGALSSLDEVYRNELAPTILITDGNQTFGRDYRFEIANYSNTIFPVVAGDTTAYQDLSINRINANKYAYLNNRFPVEIFVDYSGKEPVETKFEIRSGTELIYSEAVSMDADNNSHVLRTDIAATKTGTLTYEAKLLPIPVEKDTMNNRKNFAVEVIDERTSVLLVTSIIHPDLGTLKKSIESNQQREVEIHQISAGLPELNNYQLIILYQPDQNFSGLLEKIREENRNYWMITGSETDWRFLNDSQRFFQKEITGQTEEYFAVVNENFNLFQFEDAGFSDFPPLKSSFGDVVFTVPAVPVLYRQVAGIKTENPLLAISDRDNSRKAVLFGEDIWKWRAASYVENGSFQEFDEFTGKLVQFLASAKKRDRLTIEYERFYYGYEPVVISAQYFDRTYQFDRGGDLSLKLVNKETGESQMFPLMAKQNKYEINLNDLPPSEYAFEVKVAGEDLIKPGEFIIVESHVEQQFSNANVEGLQKISEEKNTPLYFLKDSKELVNKLLSDNSYSPVQKREEKDVPLIDWYYLLGIITFSLSAEWFLRKYYGLI